MNTFKRLGILIIVMVVLIGSTGCSKIIREDTTKLPLVAALSEKEVIDYYAKSMSYDAIVHKNIAVERTNYETKEVTNEEKLRRLNDLQKKTEKLLGEMNYTYSKANAELLDENTFHYIKSFVNDRKLTNPKVISVEEAIGHYFIDVEYDITNRSIGSFTNRISLLGINGAFIKDVYNNDKIDNAFIRKAVSELNNYYNENRVDKAAHWNEGTGLLSITKRGESPNIDYTQTTITDNQVNEGNIEVENTEETEENINENDEAIEEEEETQVENDVDINQDLTTILNNRYPSIDINEFHKIAGSSTRQTAYMPKLNLVYNIPANEGTIGGIGAYPSGANGLAKFQFSRSQMTGKCTLRYVYKDDINNPNKILAVNVYPVSFAMDSGIGNINADTSGSLIIPDFLKEEFEKIIERSDRAMVNKDITALMSGNIYTDSGMAILIGYEDQYVNLLRQMTTFRRLITRDTKQNAYVVEVERLRQEGPKGADVYGTYIDTGYMVIEQVGSNFYITDWYPTLREMKTEPDINPDSAIIKRLVALNLAGAVSEENKNEITNLMGDFYKASTHRVLRGPQEVDGVEIEKGMYDCFNSDVTMLSSTRNEYINSTIREQLVKHGVNTKSRMVGSITSWIGGADRQAEFITEEVITYSGRSNGTRFEVYYLVSRMEDKWVIDERTVINSEELTGDALKNIVDRIDN